MTDWASLVRPSLVGLEPYDPGASVAELRVRHRLDDLVKLNWNEGLFGPAPEALDAAAAELANAWMYPEQAYAELRAAIGGWLGVEQDQVVLGHGIQALVTTVTHALVTPGAAAVVPTPTYGLYAQVLAAAGAEVRRVPLRGLRIDLPAMAAAARDTRARVAVVCDPNNPTGDVLPGEAWGEFLAALPAGCVVVADEAYAEYVDPALRIRREHDVSAGRPVVVLRTFSKLFGLAGLRLGYAVAAPELARFLDVVQEPFNVNRAALAAGRASIAVPGLVEHRRARTAAARHLLSRRLSDAGCTPFPSHANFLLVDVGVDDVRLVQGVLRRGLLIRAGSELGMPGRVRITVAAEDVMERVAREVAAVRAELVRGGAGARL